jgi:hypothetical protein
LENLNSRLMQELNWWRNIYWLPALTTDALNNFDKRVSLYDISSADIWMDNAVNNIQSFRINN